MLYIIDTKIKLTFVTITANNQLLAKKANKQVATGPEGANKIENIPQAQ